MSNLSFLNFHYGVSKTPNPNPRTPSFSKATQRPNSSKSNSHRPINIKAQDLKCVFDKFDTNRDGKISPEEYKSAMRALGKGEAEIEGFRAMDSDGDGFVDFDEFVEMYGAGGVTAGEMERAFRVFDLDGDGKISAEELREVLRGLGERCSLGDCRKMVRGVDKNGDGLIDLDEFLVMIGHSLKVA
ncbi:calmodulin-like protein 30 [Malania oleifera]|uniref:calmodulin-like protein 30 n=1 Tax=Malania oleifera TaxID=397392 RepID=UPI0025ADF551|nr:calmodulin-like protein 30 [Malania oleifera]